MRSEFLGLENAILYFQVLTEDTEPDAFGNVPAPVYKPRKIDAFLKSTTDPGIVRTLQQDPRAEADSVALKGYCVEPMILPSAIVEEMEAELTFNRRPGKFLLISINPPYGRDGIGGLIEKEAGTSIVGWFTPDRQQ
ncbi:hypothetical protein H6G00_05170 [Leptolyngbya sp. FACHB-541]|uniref:hypothetical protein n=1 Tax=Leptolyngbya sp. FACHB-541 TaxID=2692810 RepID=UPI0016885E7B|nr:hypothetical protein [Leptolyngbya sp. FACHB-541]MBD1996007.1 hypothetical protein [Leptolyngbya sp. FACHB-541]